jgi:malate/lactate dehydrogenase
MAAAYALFLNRSAEEIILVDKNMRRAEGEAMDMMHGQACVGHIAVRAGGYPDLAAAQIVIIAAGVAQRPGESRLDLLNRNADVLGQIAAQLDRDAAYDIIDRKNYTHTGIGAVLARLSEAVLEDPKSILTVSAAMAGEYGLNRVWLSIPCVIGFQGIEARLTPDLTEEELLGIQASARRLKQNIDKINWNRA